MEEESQAQRRWRNPLAGWAPERGADEVPTPTWQDPLAVWRAQRGFTASLRRLGRLRFFGKFRAHGHRLWHRTR